MYSVSALSHDRRELSEQQPFRMLLRNPAPYLLAPPNHLRHNGYRHWPNLSIHELLRIPSNVFRVRGLGFGDWVLGIGVEGLGFRVWGLGFGVRVLGVKDLRFMVYGLWFGV
ncbi:hypothetical protein T484DRAFT_3402198 [Baffinella frigidus]|nr:hypothetical protein T484DRAFT_3402198 [Cryptophyta sp. CCMP2293]